MKLDQPSKEPFPRNTAFEVGIYSFAELTPDPVTGERISPAQRLHNLIETIELADQVGLDVFGLGEHHRPDFVSSAPVVILATAAARTKSIRLSTAVTVLSSDDPCASFRILRPSICSPTGAPRSWRGAARSSNLSHSSAMTCTTTTSLFAEKLDLLLKLRESERITWSGAHRPALNNLGVYPRPLQEKLPIWIAVGGTPESVVRAATLGLPMALAIIGGMPERFAPLAQLYRDAARQAGHDPAQLPLSINSHGFIGDSSQQAVDDYYPSAVVVMNKIGRERGWASATRQQLEVSRTLRGADFVGTPAEIVEKTLFQHEIFGHQRLLLQLGVGTIAHTKVMRAIELYGTQVAPVVRKEIARRNATAQSG